MDLKKRLANLEEHAKAKEDQRPPDTEVERLSNEVDELWVACSFDGPTEEATAAQ